MSWTSKIFLINFRRLSKENVLLLQSSNKQKYQSKHGHERALYCTVFDELGAVANIDAIHDHVLIWKFGSWFSSQCTPPPANLLKLLHTMISSTLIRINDWCLEYSCVLLKLSSVYLIVSSFVRYWSSFSTHNRILDSFATESPLTNISSSSLITFSIFSSLIRILLKIKFFTLTFLYFLNSFKATC